MNRQSIFRKIVLALALLLVPIMLLFLYANQVSVRVIEREIQSSHASRLSFFVSQINAQVSQLSLLSVMSGRHAAIREYQETYLSSPILNLDQQKTKRAVEDMLKLQSDSAGWTNTLRLYSPSLGEYVGSDRNGSFRVEQLQQSLALNWTELESAEEGIYKEIIFTRDFVAPYVSREQLQQANTVVRVAFGSGNLRRMLDEFKGRDDNETFLYRRGAAPILNSTIDVGLTAELTAELDRMELSERGYRQLELSGMNYLVAYEKLTELDRYAVAYVPLQSILAPLTETRRWFYIAAVSLLALAMLSAFLLYRGVQLPIKQLVQALQQFKRGQFATRLGNRPGDEFGFVFDRFNDMAAQIENLVTSVYKEQLRSREALLKQLQAQINPHFLYNCLAFITSMAKLKNNEAVIAMGINLGQYYRYTARMEHNLVTVNEELEVLDHYMRIQNMRNERIQYEIEADERVRAERIPRLLLQPLAENAVVHGLEARRGIGWVKIRGTVSGTMAVIEVEDNGVGMEPEAMRRLEAEIRKPEEQAEGHGLWNVRQRLRYRFGERATLTFHAAQPKGLLVRMAWPLAEPEPQREQNGDDGA